ncbi:MAG TPA: Ig-like domain-containing protein [Kofleriaceae bacterium]|nr:Ig-like domain-containing protein [Kofleriaceae bacterium]
MRFVVLVCLVAACGKVEHLADAPLAGDGKGADANTGPDADAHGPVTVTVYDQYNLQDVATPTPDIPVVFIEADGTVTANVTTGADGTATANVLAGASVTVIYGSGTSDRRLETITGVKPGDNLTVGPMGYPSREKTSAAYTANVPERFSIDALYEVYGPCGSSSSNLAGSGAPTPVNLAFYKDCEADPMNLLAIAYNNDRIADGYIEQTGVAEGAGSGDMPNNWQPFATTTSTFTNIPTADVTSISMDKLAPDIYGWDQNGYTFDGNTTQTITFSAPLTASALMLTRFNGDNGREQRLYEIVDGTKTDYGADVTATLLPWLSIPGLDRANHTITVTVTGTGSGDVFDAEVDYYRTDANQNTTSIAWQIFGPTAGDLVMPPLPAALADNLPQSNDVVQYSFADLVEADGVASYDDLRGDLFGALAAYQRGRGAIGSKVRISHSNMLVGFTSIVTSHFHR